MIARMACCIVVLALAGLYAGPPEAEISNGLVTIKLYPPDAQDPVEEFVAELEGFGPLNIEPGKKTQWKYRYSFYTTEGK